jgi:hypothetical protein
VWIAACTGRESLRNLREGFGTDKTKRCRFIFRRSTSFLIPIPGSPSEPSPKAENETHAARVLACTPGKRGGLAELPFVSDADIGGKLAIQLVAKPETGIDLRDPRADEPRGIRLAVKIDLKLRL